MRNDLLMGDGLRRSAGKFPLKIAAKDRYRQITYGELNARVNQLAHGLLSVGLRKGDAVAVSVGNRIEHLEIIFAAAKIGALAIPLDVKWKALELASVLSAFEPRFIVSQEDVTGEFAKAGSLKDLRFIKAVSLSADRSYGGVITGQSADEPTMDVNEDDPFAVMLTSGTTGFPKGCLTTHRTFVFHCINNAIEKGLGAHDKALLSSPIYFNAGRSFTLGIIYFGGTMILHERFDAEQVLEAVESEKITYIGAVPTMCERMLHVLEARRYDTSSLRCLAITGGKVHPAVLERLTREITPNIYRTYASTDSGQMAISKPGDMDAKPSSAGRPVWCVDLRIIDDNNRPVPVGEVGRDHLSQSIGDARLLQKSPSDARLVSRRLVLHRRSWLFRRGRFSFRGRTQKGHGQKRRHQHLSTGDRECDLQPSGHLRSGGDRSAGPRMGRSRESGRGAQARCQNDRRSSDRIL
jgi:acyl-CoA synthetase (AMP-forming)/AMP-acid ligase II